MPYTPDATVITEPVDGQKATTAALEFRTLKSYIATEIIAKLVSKTVSGNQTIASYLRATGFSVGRDYSGDGRQFSVMGSPLSSFSPSGSTVADWGSSDSGISAINIYNGSGAGQYDIAVNSAGSGVSTRLSIRSTLILASTPYIQVNTGSGTGYFGSGALATGATSADLVLRSDSGSLVFSYNGSIGAYLNSSNIFTVRSSYQKFDTPGLTGFLGTSATLNSGGAAADLTLRVDGGNLILSCNSGINAYVRASDGVFVSQAGFASTSQTYGSLVALGSAGGYAGIAFNTASKTLMLGVGGSAANVGIYNNATAAWTLLWVNGALNVGTVPYSLVTGAPTALSQFTNDIGAGGGSGIPSFNSRTGAITLLSADVTGALGYTPYSSSNPAGYQTTAGTVNTASNQAGGSVSASSITSSTTIVATGLVRGNGSGGNGLGTITVSPSAPSGGSDGDIWFQY